MTGVESALLQIERDALAVERARLAVAEQLLELVDMELAAMQEGVTALAAMSHSSSQHGGS